MTKSAYLYGEDVEVPEIPNEIIVRRLELLNDHLTELLEVPWMTRDAEKCNAVLKGIKFWETINEN